MAKDSVVTCRIDYLLKRRAEKFLSKEGISRSVAMRSFYEKIIENKGLPFKIDSDSKKKKR